MSESPRLRLALRAVSNDRETFEEAYRTMKAAEIAALYDLSEYDIGLLRAHWGIEAKMPARNRYKATPAPAQVNADELACKVVEALAPRFDELEKRINQLAAAVRRVEEQHLPAGVALLP